MKAVLLIFLALSHSLIAETLETYTNDRFFYSAAYPADIFVDKSYPENGDGVWLRDHAKSVQLTLSGSYAVVSDTMREAYDNAINWYSETKEIEITYKIQKKNWYVISGYDHKKQHIFYEKRFWYEVDGSKIIAGYLLSYPIVERDKYNALITTLNQQFHYGQ